MEAEMFYTGRHTYMMKLKVAFLNFASTSREDTHMQALLMLSFQDMVHTLCASYQYYSEDQMMKKNEMGGTCVTYGVDKSCI